MRCVALTASACQNKQHTRRNTKFRTFKMRQDFFKAPVLVLWMCCTFRLFIQPTFLGFRDKRACVCVRACVCARARVCIYIHNEPTSLPESRQHASTYTSFSHHADAGSTHFRNVGTYLLPYTMYGARRLIWLQWMLFTKRSVRSHIQDCMYGVIGYMRIFNEITLLWPQQASY